MRASTKEKQLRVLNHKLNGKSAEEIAELENIKVRRIEALIGKLKDEYGAKNIVHLIGMLICNGEIQARIVESEKLELVENRNELYEAVKKINSILSKM